MNPNFTTHFTSLPLELSSVPEDTCITSVGVQPTTLFFIADRPEYLQAVKHNRAVHPLYAPTHVHKMSIFLTHSAVLYTLSRLTLFQHDLAEPHTTVCAHFVHFSRLRLPPYDTLTPPFNGTYVSTIIVPGTHISKTFQHGPTLLYCSLVSYHGPLRYPHRLRKHDPSLHVHPNHRIIIKRYI